MLEIITQIKKCYRCKIEKDVSFFHRDKTVTDGFKNECKDCRKLFYNKNINIFHKKRAERYSNNKEILLKKRKEYVNENIEKVREYNISYSKSKNGIASRKNTKHKRRAKEKQGDVTTQQLLELEQNATNCYWCNCSLKNKTVHLDHYIPLSKGGEHTIGNLVISCQKCNLSKNAKDPYIFALQKGRLL